MFVVPFFSTRMCTCGFWRTSSSSEILRPPEGIDAQTCLHFLCGKKRFPCPHASFPWITSP